jgi:AGZA family xanthine/uracil permease-like MFS transporter
MQWAQAAELLPQVLELPPESHVIDPAKGLLPTEWLAALRFQWLGALRESFQYLPIVIPFALATVVGGIDCTESAAAAGDEYDTGQVIAVEAFATIVASLCGGVIQTTPYIGHPAYKAMGGRAAYVLATALFVGSAGLLGYFGYLYVIVPKVTIYPILIFIGLEITAQSFHHTPPRHYAAVALACIPALAQLGLMFVDQIFGDPSIREAGLSTHTLQDKLLAETLTTLRILANGFIVTSLIWASALAALIDRRLWRAACFFLVAGGLTLFGIMHSPEPGAPMYLPWQLAAEAQRHVLQFAAGYVSVALLLFAWGWLLKSQGVAPILDPPPVHEAHHHADPAHP